MGMGAAPTKRSKRGTQALEPRAGEAAHLLKLLANEQRLIILCRLSDAEMSVSELGQHVDLAQAALSQHLAKLRAEGLVATRREGQMIYYRLASPMAAKLVGALCELYGGKST
jgi:ArsR family transcriptional regulator, virulence genes transcriptional regulator